MLHVLSTGMLWSMLYLQSTVIYRKPGEIVHQLILSTIKCLLETASRYQLAGVLIEFRHHNDGECVLRLDWMAQQLTTQPSYDPFHYQSFTNNSNQIIRTFCCDSISVVYISTDLSAWRGSTAVVACVKLWDKETNVHPIWVMMKQMQLDNTLDHIHLGTKLIISPGCENVDIIVWTNLN